MPRTKTKKTVEIIKDIQEPIKITPVLNIEDDDFSSEDLKIEKDLASKPDR